MPAGPRPWASSGEVGEQPADPRELVTVARGFVAPNATYDPLDWAFAKPFDVHALHKARAIRA